MEFRVVPGEVDDRDIFVEVNVVVDDEGADQSEEDDVDDKISCGLTYYATQLK